MPSRIHVLQGNRSLSSVHQATDKHAKRREPVLQADVWRLAPHREQRLGPRMPQGGCQTRTRRYYTK